LAAVSTLSVMPKISKQLSRTPIKLSGYETKLHSQMAKRLSVANESLGE
jgi:hypothetical protein